MLRRNAGSPSSFLIEAFTYDILMINMRYFARTGLFPLRHEFLCGRLHKDCVQPYPRAVMPSNAPSMDNDEAKRQLYYCRVSLALYGPRLSKNLLGGQPMNISQVNTLKRTLRRRIIDNTNSTLCEQGRDGNLNIFAKTCFLNPNDVSVFQPTVSPYSPACSIFLCHQEKEIIIAASMPLDHVHTSLAMSLEPCDVFCDSLSLQRIFRKTTKERLKCIVSGLASRPTEIEHRANVTERHGRTLLHFASHDSQYYARPDAFICAARIFLLYRDAVKRLLVKHQSYSLVLTGHGVGGSAAILLGWLLVQNGILRDKEAPLGSDTSEPSIDATSPLVHTMRIHTFSSAPCASPAVYEDLRRYSVTCILYDKDLIPRLTLRGLFGSCYRLYLLAEILRRRKINKLIVRTRACRSASPESNSCLQTHTETEHTGATDHTQGLPSCTTAPAASWPELLPPSLRRRETSQIEKIDKERSRKLVRSIRNMDDTTLYDEYTRRTLQPLLPDNIRTLYLPVPVYVLYSSDTNSAGPVSPRPGSRYKPLAEKSCLRMGLISTPCLDEILLTLDALKDHYSVYRHLKSYVDDLSN